MKSRTRIVACLMLVATCALPAVARGTQRIAPHQEIVALLSSRGVRDRPNVRDRLVAFVSATRPITGEQTVLPVLAQTIDNHGRAWLRVRLPGRTLGRAPPPSVGWISASRTLISTTAWHIVVSLGARQVQVYRHGRLQASYPAIVGKPSTPTPTGEYFVEESVQVPTNQPGGPLPSLPATALMCFKSSTEVPDKSPSTGSTTSADN